MLSQPNQAVAAAAALLPDRAAPVHTHDCDQCVYLGSTFDRCERVIDLWVHPSDRDAFRTIIARWSSRGPDYMSGLEFRHLHPLALAYLVAVDRGLIPAMPDRPGR